MSVHLSKLPRAELGRFRTRAEARPTTIASLTRDGRCANFRGDVFIHASGASGIGSRRRRDLLRETGRLRKRAQPAATAEIERKIRMENERGLNGAHSMALINYVSSYVSFPRLLTNANEVSADDQRSDDFQRKIRNRIVRQRNRA